MIDTMQTIYMILRVLFIIRYTINAVCPANCNTCENYDKCTSCKSDNWNLNVSCISTCSSNCLNKECQDDNGFCHQCKTGLYGNQCQRNCSFCEQELRDLRACTLGCKFGYYSFSDGSETFCQPCQTDCRTCRNSYVCDVCNDGFYLYKHMFNSKIYGTCSPCPDSSQSCKDLCAIQDCSKCQVLPDKIVCSECREGFEFNGDICVMKIAECSKGCSTSCDDNRICLGSCNIGWTNERCSESCASLCLTCSRNNAIVCEQCKGDFYTTGCNIECPEHCNRMLSKQTCRIDGGYCLNGYTTSMRITVTQSDVHDVSTIQTSTHFWPEVKDNNNGFITGYFSGIGSAAMVASLIVAIVCIKRRYFKSTEGLFSFNQTHTYYNERIEPRAVIEGRTDGTNNYDKLNANREAEMTYSDLQRQI